MALNRLPAGKGAVAAVKQGHGQQQADHCYHIVPKQEQDGPNSQAKKQGGLIEKMRAGGEGTLAGKCLPDGEKRDAQETRNG